MSKPAVCALLLSVAAHGAVIRGVVVEKQTGYLLSHAVVTLQSLSVQGQSDRSVRTSDSGQFEFGRLPLGAYLLTASRRGFLPAQYGQKRWNSAGTPIIIDRDAVTQLQFSLLRYGAITGIVRDSNEVGIPDQGVAAYTATQPPQLMVRTKSDDRGIYRLAGLTPGTYLVRTTGDVDDDLSYIPTFSRRTFRVEEARPVTVYPDEDTNDGDIRPIAGPLFEISGTASPGPGFVGTTVTLASDTGRIMVQGETFRFEALPPGRYEVYAEAHDSTGTRFVGGYTEIPFLNRELKFAMPMNAMPAVTLRLEGAGPTVASTGFVRRIDLAGPGPVKPLKLGVATTIPLLQGRWEFLVGAPNGYYVSQFAGSRNNIRGDAWNEVQVRNSTGVTVMLSRGGGTVYGTVKTAGMAVFAAPVSLQAWDFSTRKPLGELRQIRTDASGGYRFDNLAPGTYRILATFDYATPDAATFDLAQAQSLQIEANTNQQLDLSLWSQ
jgi:hypothetical protein